MRLLEEVCLWVDEAEAIRLKDFEGLEQEEGADRMGVSRPTFQRILSSGRQKVADALLNGKAMRIEGGHIELAAGPPLCPHCRSPKAMPIRPGGQAGRCGFGQKRPAIPSDAGGDSGRQRPGGHDQPGGD